MPSRAALERLLYNSTNGSANDADVIALCLTDLRLDDVMLKKRADEVRYLLKNTLADRDNYVFNEDDKGLFFHHIPAVLIHANDGNSRFCSLHVAVHKRNVQDIDRDGEHDHTDIFPQV